MQNKRGAKGNILMSGPKGTLVFIFNLLHQESDNHQTFFIAFPVKEYIIDS